jgi:hypothetical protein
MKYEIYAVGMAIEAGYTFDTMPIVPDVGDLIKVPMKEGKAEVHEVVKRRFEYFSQHDRQRCAIDLHCRPNQSE